MDQQQSKVLVELDNRLQDALEAAKSRQHEMITRLDESRLVIEQLLRLEAQETELYVENMRLQMHAIRDVLQLEMKSARREIRLAMEEAKLNITQARRQRDLRREELNAKILKLQELKKVRAQQRAEEIERVKQEAMKEAHRLVHNAPLDAVSSAAHFTTAVQSHAAVEATSKTPLLPNAHGFHYSSSGTQEDPTWALPFAMTLVLGACLWVIYARYRMKRAASERHQRLLYSDQLRSHFAKAVPSQKVVETEKDEATSEENRPPEETHPVLRRRLRPGWSPSASTASTVSVADAPTARE